MLCRGNTAGVMSQVNVDTVRALYEDFGEGRFWASASQFDREIEFERIGEVPGGAGRWQGLDAFTTAFREYLEAFDALYIKGERFVDLGDRVLVVARHSGTGRGSGLAFEREIGDVLTLRDGLVVRWQTYWDLKEALEAVELGE